MDRKIIHIDMDAFYASVEQRDNPILKGKPLIVGGDPGNRGVVATCSYEARKFGIHSAMSCKEAYKLCPHAVFVRPRFDVYTQVSMKIREIFYRYTDLVEPLSLDEAFLDVTNNKKNIKYATTVAKMIKRDIKEELNLTASAGVSYNKFLAKVASDYVKPSGLTVIKPHETQDFLDKLPIRKFYGVGKVTEERLLRMGIKTGYDLRHIELRELESLFKKTGYMLYYFSRGIDNRPVENNRIRKSVGSEFTLENDLDFEDDEVIGYILDIAKDVEYRLQRANKLGKTITLKIKYEDFTNITRSITVNEYIYSYKEIYDKSKYLYDNVNIRNKKIRLIGITMSNLIGHNERIYENISMFDKILI